MVHALVGLCLSVAVDSPKAQSVSRNPTAADRKLADAWFAERRRILKQIPATDQSPEARRLWIAAKSGDIQPPPIEHPLAVGAIGTLQGGTFRLIQRSGNSEGRIAIQKPPQARDARRATGGKQKKPAEVVVLLRGFDLSDKANNQECEAEGCFTVTKMDSYSTPSGGSRKLLVIKPFDSSIAESLFRQAVKQELDSQPD